jgi:hypothetical protein
MTDEPIFRVRLEAAALADLRTYLDELDPDVGCRPVAKKSADGFTIDVHLPESQLATARGTRAANRVSVEVLENETEAGRSRQAEVGAGNRFAARGDIPRGLGRKE